MAVRDSSAKRAPPGGGPGSESQSHRSWRVGPEWLYGARLESEWPHIEVRGSESHTFRHGAASRLATAPVSKTGERWKAPWGSDSAPLRDGCASRLATAPALKPGELHGLGGPTPSASAFNVTWCRWFACPPDKRPDQVRLLGSRLWRDSSVGPERCAHNAEAGCSIHPLATTGR